MSRLFICLVCVFFLIGGSPVSGQRSRTPAPKPKRVTLMVRVVAVPAVDHALVQPVATDKEGEPPPFAEPFAAYLTPKTEYFRDAGNVGTVPFVTGERRVLRVDLYGTLPNLQGRVRELWDEARFLESQEQGKEIKTGTVVSNLTERELSGTLTIKDEDGKTFAYKVTATTRFLQGDKQVYPSVYSAGVTVAVKPRAAFGKVYAGVVAESKVAVERGYKDTLSVWKGVVERVETSTFFFVLRREDGAKRIVRFPKVIKILSEADEKKNPLGGRVYVLQECIEKTVIVRLAKREKPAPDGTRTAERITLTGEPSRLREDGKNTGAKE